MNWLQKMERKFGRYAIHNLMFYIIVLNILGFVLYTAQPQFYYGYLQLSMAQVFRGQVWRLVSFILVPPDDTIIGMFFFCLLYYTIGQALENSWGAFRFNVYYFSGVLLHILAALIVYLVFGIDMELNLTWLNTSLFLAFGAEYPDYELLIMFILPVKVKWLAIIDGVLMGIAVIGGYLSVLIPSSVLGITTSLSTAVAATIALGNFLVYFFTNSRFARYSPKQVKRRTVYKAKVKMSAPKNVNGGTRHKCAICGRTEMDDPSLEFRFCSKCEGSYEYCMDHLYTHKHVGIKND